MQNTPNANLVGNNVVDDSTYYVMGRDLIADGTKLDGVDANASADGVGVVVNSGSTVAGLPGAPTVGMMRRVTDATTPAIGSTVAGGGAAAALVWYNGSNWTVIGI